MGQGNRDELIDSDVDVRTSEPHGPAWVKLHVDIGRRGLHACKEPIALRVSGRRRKKGRANIFNAHGLHGSWQ